MVDGGDHVEVEAWVCFGVKAGAEAESALGG